MEKAGVLDPVRSSLVNVIVKQVMVVLIGKLPFISFGPLAYLASTLLGWLFGIALDKTILGINLAIIDFKVDAETKELKDLLEKIKTIPLEDKNERDRIENEIVDSARDLISLRDKPRV
jgi:hypothetical protein